ncbi:MAG TPA: NAD(P)-dependent oxidoreductase [Tepidisphaeraceae bacterium]|jgi:3-hydroxyisobutyrate dehydrogenase
MENPLPVAFLGLGIMGSGMARRLLRPEFKLTVYNRNPARASELGAAGAAVARTPREAAQKAAIVISMVADDAASRAVWLGDEGALAGVMRDAVLVECSTLSVEWVRELAAAAQKKGCELLDAPVTGTKPHAASGELNFLIGGSEKALATARPVLEVMGKNITHLGPTGSGALLKLINNFVCGAQLAGLAEGLALIERSGLNREQALGVLANGAPGSPLFKTLSARMTSRDFTPNFHLRLMAKDLQYAINEGKRHSLDLTTAAAALRLLDRAKDAGLGEKDMSAVVETLRQK